MTAETVSTSRPASNGGGIPPPGSRSAEQIRADIVRQREQFGRSVESLRGRVTEITDVRGQLRRHRGELIVGAAIVGGLVIGALQNLASGYLDPCVGGGLKNVFPFFVLVAILMLKPYGLFGRERIERV